MRITKFVHSCLLIEDQNQTFLIDPGNYTKNSGLFNLNSIAKIDFILITHEHADHMDIDLIKTILKKFPDLKIIANESSKILLDKAGITSEDSIPSFIEMENISATSAAGMMRFCGLVFSMTRRA